MVATTKRTSKKVSPRTSVPASPRTESHIVTPGPNHRREEVVPYYEFAPDFFRRQFGCRPARNTLYKYLVRGYPVRKGGPYVQMPTFTALHRPMTTTAAMERFLTLTRKLEREAT